MWPPLVDMYSKWGVRDMCGDKDTSCCNERSDDLENVSDGIKLLSSVRVEGNNERVSKKLTSAETMYH